MNEIDLETWVQHSNKAIEADRMDVLRQALKFSAQFNKELLNAILENGNTLLHKACQANRSDAVRILLQAGADPCIQNVDGRVPLDLTKAETVRHAFVMDCIQAICRSDHHRMLQLLAAGISPNAEDSVLSKNTLLHWAASRSSLECVQSLLDRDGDVNCKNRDGLTALHEAVIRGQASIIEELLHHGSDTHAIISVGRHAGKTALDLCRELHPELVSLFTAMSSRIPSTPVQTPNDWNALTTPSLNHDPDQFSIGSRSQSTSHDQWPQEKNHWDGLRYLWPTPRCVEIFDGDSQVAPQDTVLRLAVCGPCNLHDRARVQKVVELLAEEMGRQGRCAQHEIHEHCARLSPHVPVTLELGQLVARGRPQSYQILVGDGRIRLQSSSVEGLHYACLTLLQLFLVGGADGLPPMKIVDWPSVESRGVLLDLSTGLLPKREKLLQWIDILSRMKCNQIHLFVRVSDTAEAVHGFEFSVLRSICERCRARLVVPVLALDIAATVESLLDIQPEQMDQLMSCFPSDSPIHLGPRLSLHILDALSEPSSLSLPFWLNLRQRSSIGLCPSSVRDAEKMWNLTALPLIIMDYVVPPYPPAPKRSKGYQEWMAKRDFLMKKGAPYCVCLGSSSVNSVTGCFPRVLPDMLTALCGLHDPRSSASGVLSCQWSGAFPLAQPLFGLPGHFAVLGISWYGETDAPAAMSRVRSHVLPQVLVNAETVEAFYEVAHLETQLLPIDSAPYTSLLSAASTDLQTAVESLLEHNASILKRVFHRCRACARRLERSASDKDSVTALLAYVARLLEFTCRLALMYPSHSTSEGDGEPRQQARSIARTDIANRVIILMEESEEVAGRWFCLTDRTRGALNSFFRSLLNQLLPADELTELGRKMHDVTV